MPQHDFNIANQSAPDFRADLNNALEALGTLSSGSTAPATTYANQLWYDTANNVLKMRNEADSTWIELFDFDQSAGTAKPSIPNVLDEDDFVSNSATQPPSQQSTKAYVDTNTVGVGQTWQDVFGSRVANTSYQNTTGRPIMVSVRAGSPGEGKNLEVSTNNSTWVAAGVSGNVEKLLQYAIVPGGHYYRFTGNFELWAELR